MFVGPALANPDLETFKLLHAHCPDIIHYEYNYIDILTISIREPDTVLTHYLLNHEADPNLNRLGGFWLAKP